MQRSVRYEILQNEEEQVPAEPVAMAVAPPPSPIPAQGLETEQAAQEVNKDTVRVAMPPPYSIATDLPSYEEAERTKKEEAERGEANSDLASEHAEHDRFEGMTLGTDGMFLCTFLVSFLFNWVGLLAALCVSNTVAGRFGALSGFGLSIVKWVAIVQHQQWLGEMTGADNWIFWLLMILGFLIFFRGCIQYIRLKHQWRLMTQQHRDRFIFFY